MRAAGLLIVLALVAGCGDEPQAPQPPPETPADFGLSPADMTLEGAEATVRPPAGTWLVRTDRPGPDRWTEQLRRAADGVLLQAATFPVQDARSPMPVLITALDAFVRSQGTEGFGQKKRGGGLIRGAPAAWTGFVAVIGGVPQEGRARIVLLEPDRWALALGMAPTSAGVDALALVEAFVGSLQPTRATFYARRFVDPAALDAPTAHPSGEAPVTRRDIAAVQLVIELASGTRFPLAVQPKLRRALASEALQGSAASRASFRDVTEVLRETEGMDPAEREAGMASLGKRVLEQVFNRAMEGYGPANAYRLAWTGMGKPSVGEGEDALTVAAVQSLAEMSAFLASLAADREVPATDERALAVKAVLVERFDELDADERADLARAGRLWAALRHAWDVATPEQRLAFRRAVLVALVDPEVRERVPPASDEFALLAFMHERADAGPTYALRAAALSAAEREALFALLDVDPTRHHLGW